MFHKFLNVSSKLKMLRKNTKINMKQLLINLKNKKINFILILQIIIRNNRNQLIKT